MQHTDQTLIENLKELPGVEDPHLSKRAETRTALRAKATLDLQRASGEVFSVSALDVSNSGIGFLCRRELDAKEQVGLRIAYQHESQFESFQVRRGTATIGGYKIGVVVR